MGKFVSARPVSPSPEKQASDVPFSTAFQTRFPALVEYLTVDKWDDGKPRETATISLFIDAGALKACFNDRALSRNAFVTGDSVEGILDALEAGLVNETLDWRMKKPFQAKGGKRA